MSAVNEPASTSAVSSVSTAGRAPTPGSTRTGDPFNPEGVAFQPVSAKNWIMKLLDPTPSSPTGESCWSGSASMGGNGPVVLLWPVCCPAGT